MPGRRFLYLTALVAGLVFYVFYREWLSFLLLVLLLVLPWFSLLCSLPAMLCARLRLNCPDAVELGQPGLIEASMENRFPPPPLRCHLEVVNSMTGETTVIKKAAFLPTEHCGCLRIRCRKAWVYDYLGLLRLRVRRPDQKDLLIRPVPRAVTLPDSSRCLANAWRPKPGGGFSENHELRVYRPGDSLHQIHWKLSAKTGKLMIREPMERTQGLALLTMELQGTPAQMDQKLGLLLSASRQLMAKEIPHQIHCLTAEGLLAFHIVRETDILPAVDALLRSKPAPNGAAVPSRHAPWHFHIGGDLLES